MVVKLGWMAAAVIGCALIAGATLALLTRNPPAIQAPRVIATHSAPVKPQAKPNEKPANTLAKHLEPVRILTASPLEKKPQQKGFVINTFVTSDEPCARDYVKALHSESGLEKRQKLEELLRVGCIREFAGVYAGTLLAKRVVALGPKASAQILNVLVVIDDKRTERVTKKRFNPMDYQVGGDVWVVSADFLPVTGAVFDEILEKRERERR